MTDKSNKNFLYKFLKNCPNCQTILVSRNDGRWINITHISCMCAIYNTRCYFYKCDSGLSRNNAHNLNSINHWNQNG